MKSIKLPSWISALLGLEGRLVPGHVFALDESVLRYAHLRSQGGQFHVADHQVVELPDTTFHEGLLGGPPRDSVGFAEIVRRFVEGLAEPPSEACLVLPDHWLRVSFVETAELPSQREAREEALRWKLKRLVPFRVDELRLNDYPVEPLPKQSEPERVLLGFAVESLLRHVEEAFSSAGVRLGLVSNASLSLAGALKFAIGDAELAAQCLVQEDGYALTFVRNGEPVLHRYKPITAGMAPEAYAQFVARDLRLTRSFLAENFEESRLERVVLVAPKEADGWWQDALEQGLEVAPLTVSWELLPFEGDMPMVPWEDLVAMFGAACREIA